MGVLIIRALLFGVEIGAPDFWKLPFTANHANLKLGLEKERPSNPRQPLFHKANGASARGAKATQ